MLLTKEQILGRKIVSEFLGNEQFQPCGVDLSLREVHELSEAGVIDFDNSARKIPASKALEFKNDELKLKKGAYKIIYNEIVMIPADCAAFGFSRSSLLRCGAFVNCAVWDPGYKGRSESLLIVENEHGITLKKNARLVQLVFVKLEDEAKELYRGAYHNENLRKRRRGE
ncbi:MAG: deoxyuridine 5'-triphosphate nucleotidohydrolase [Candidatus Micrarchaeota archaeon]